MRRRGDGGFTLLELLVVLALLGLLLFIVVPNLDGLSPRYRLRSAARRIATTIEMAQGEAISKEKELAICYDLDHHTYWVILPAPDPQVPTAQPDPKAPPPPPIDAEHGPVPPFTETTADGKPTAPSPVSSSPATALRSYEGRETLAPETLPDDVYIESVSLQSGQEATSGTIVVPFSPTGDEGSHTLLLRRKSDDGYATKDEPIAVRFNALTRTIDFANEKLGWTQLAPQ